MPPDAEQNLTRRTLGGLQWSYAEAIVGSLLQIVVAGVLARVLDPVDFGLVALSALALRFVTQVSRGGLAQAIVQKPDLDDTDIRSGFTLALLLGVAFALVGILVAPVAGIVFDSPEVVPVLRWMSLSVPIVNLGMVSDGILRRELRFRTVAVRNVASYVVGYAGVGVVMGLMGFGVWALVAASLTQSGLVTIFTYVAVRHPVAPQLDRASLRALLGFGGQVSVIGFFEFLGGELDTLAVGRFAGVSALGLYNRGYYLVELPLQQINISFSRVLFPALSRVQHETDRLRAAYLSAVRVSAALLLPVAAGIAVAAIEIVEVLLGSKWSGAASVMPWIALSSGLSTITHFAGITAEAKGELGPKLKAVIVQVIVLAVSLYVVRDQELWAFGAAIMLSAVVAHVGYTTIAARITGTTLVGVVRAYMAALPAAMAVGGAILGVRVGMIALGVPVVLVLAAEVATGAIVLFVLLRWGWLQLATREVIQRLANAGLLVEGSRATALAARVLGPVVARIVAREA